jgi:hypothetical protein
MGARACGIYAPAANRWAASERGQGRTVFLYTFIPQHRLHSSGLVPRAAEVIEAIEAPGWGLQQIAWDGEPGDHSRDRGAVLMLFRVHYLPSQ